MENLTTPQINSETINTGREPSVQTPPQTRQLYKSPVLAGLFSTMLPGLGQVYVGYYRQGFIFIAIFILPIFMLSSMGAGGLEPILGIFIPFFYIFNIIDAVRRAKVYNHVVDGISQAELPDDLNLPGMAGSTVGGVVLVLIGTLLFLNTMFDISLVWLEDWWPLALIIGGVYLIYKDAKDRGKDNALTRLFKSDSSDSLVE